MGHDYLKGKWFSIGVIKNVSESDKCGIAQHYECIKCH